MNFSGTRKIILMVLVAILGLVSVGLGTSLGFAIAITKNTQNTENKITEIQSGVCSIQ